MVLYSNIMDIKEMYKKGMTTVEIGKIVGHCPQTVCTRLRELDVELRKCGHRKGVPSNYKGLTYEEVYGVEKSNEIKDKIRKKALIHWKEQINKYGDNITIKILRKRGESKRWHKVIKERDNYTCRDCGSKKNIEAHHIKSFADYPDLRFKLSNGKTLCKVCHVKTYR